MLRSAPHANGRHQHDSEQQQGRCLAKGGEASGILRASKPLRSRTDARIGGHNSKALGHAGSIFLRVDVPMKTPAQTFVRAAGITRDEGVGNWQEQGREGRDAEDVQEPGGQLQYHGGIIPRAIPATTLQIL
ncbi:MAG: hypothetical protein WCS65_07705 [Verrucomicrobiae bacterium]